MARITRFVGMDVHAETIAVPTPLSCALPVFPHAILCMTGKTRHWIWDGNVPLHGWVELSDTALTRDGAPLAKLSRRNELCRSGPSSTTVTSR